MNTLWLKIASGAIGILIVIVLINMFMSGGDKEPATKPVPEANSLPSNFWAQTEQDKKDLNVPENYAENSGNDSQPATEPPQSNDTVSPVPPGLGQSQPTAMTIYVKKPNSSEQAEAEKQLNFALTSFEVGRLPGTSYKTAVDAARGVINRWPESIYAFNSKLLLAKVPERYQQQYKITPEELDTKIFLQPRAGTMPVKVKIEDRS